MTTPSLLAERQHLAGLLEAVQRCVYFLHASRAKAPWPLRPEALEARQKDIALFETLSAMNERFSKLQDTLGAAMRHAYLLSGESGETFLRVLAFYEKIGVLDAVSDWQLCRTTRKLAAHAYETDYAVIAAHFNTLNELTPMLYGVAARFMDYCQEALGVQPLSDTFTAEFHATTQGSPLAQPTPSCEDPTP
jgi:hypothetical protein